MTVNWQDLAQRFRPIYKLHSEELYYPLAFPDLLEWFELIRVDAKTRSVVQILPAAWQNEGPPQVLVNADTLLATAAGQTQVRESGVKTPYFDQDTQADLQPKSIDGSKYKYLLPRPNYLLRPSQIWADGNYLSPLGNLANADLGPINATSYRHGSPNCGLKWLNYTPPITCKRGADETVSAFDPDHVGAPFAHPSRGPFQKIDLICWAQQHVVNDVLYVDLIYTAHFGYNGSIGFVPGQGEHYNDIVTHAVRFHSDDLATPLRYYYSQHGGYSWYLPADIQTQDGRAVIYLARQSHEQYPVPGRFARLWGLADDITDDKGVTWTPDALYVNRPSGIDSDGVDTDALRCQISPGRPNDVVLIPPDTPGPLWQYVGFRFVQLGGDGLDPKLTSQGAALFTQKWWLGEGPAGTKPPLSLKAAIPNIVGMPNSFFDNAAPYLGQRPLPSCRGTMNEDPSCSNDPRPFASFLNLPEPAGSAGNGNCGEPATISYRQIMPDVRPGSLRAQVPPYCPVPVDGAPYIDWTGPSGSAGAYIIEGFNSFAIPYLKSKLPDKLRVDVDWSKDIGITTLQLDDITLSGLASTSVDKAHGSAPHAISLSARANEVAARASLKATTIVGPVTVASVTAVLQGLVFQCSATVLAPLAVTAEPSSQWYIARIYPTECTPQVCRAQIPSGGITLTISNSVVHLGGLISWLIPYATEIVGLIASLLTNQFATLAADRIVSVVNGLLSDIYSGRMRID